jgi:hypothetical protein
LSLVFGSQAEGAKRQRISLEDFEMGLIKALTHPPRVADRRVLAHASQAAAW